MTCKLCASDGAVIEMEVRDYHFGSPGAWSYHQCQFANCGLVWIDPVPSREELVAAYGSYYTHSQSEYSGLRRAVQASAYKFSGGLEGALHVRAWLYGLPILGRVIEDSVVSLGAMVPQKGGVILDVGCGNGERLELFRAAGWKSVVGVEPDGKAADVGRSLGREILDGEADRIPLPDGSVDAVFLHHVIEHLAEPMDALGEIRRVLKGGGILSIITPNFMSAGRRKWGKYWRGYEAPRHIFLYNKKCLGALVQQAGFRVIMARTSARAQYWMECCSDSAARGAVRRETLIRSLLFADREFRSAHGVDVSHEVGEELVLVARLDG